jgi:hypothetical protein
VETQNDCKVAGKKSEHLSWDLLQSETELGKLKNVNDVSLKFNLILLLIFITSLLSSILYIRKTLLFFKERS